MLVLMTIAHLFIFPFRSIDHLKHYTYGSLGFFTDAEGFFFLSGLVASLVYGRMFLEGKEPQAKARIFKRIRQLYLWQSVLFLALALSIMCFDKYLQNWRLLHEIVPAWIGNEGLSFLLDHPLQAFSLGSCFLYLPTFLDLLPLYVVFLAVTPLVLRKLKEGKIVLVSGVSLTLWAATQFIPPRILEKTLKVYLPAVKLGWFDLLAWQLLFVAGLIFGYLNIAGRLPKISRPLAMLSILMALLFFCLRHWGPSFPVAANLYELGFFRLLSFGAIACTAWAFSRWCVVPLLAYLGKYSLQVFLYHVALIFFLVFFQVEITALSFFSKIVLMICCILSLWIPAYVCERSKQRRIVAVAGQ